jgi:hypothetical protein
MQIESILIFIAFIVISSLFNRKKQAQQQRNRQESQKPTESRQARPQQTAPRPAPRKRTLQDVFREMQQELERDFRPAEPDRSLAEQKAKAERIRRDQQTEPVKQAMPPGPTREQKPKSPVYAGEIKDQPVQVGFQMTEESILNGIIFSEVIGKPKSKKASTR